MAEATGSVLKSRNVQVDLLRFMAIALVLCFHFDDILPWGFLGVDVFFVISGYLVSKPLIASFENKNKINWREFAIKRIFKILPSYFFFLFVAYVIARLFILPEFPIEVFGRQEYLSFIFLYVNYTGTLSWIFGHIWSLCIEEHFYIFLPLVFLLMYFVQKKFNQNFLIIILVSVIFSTIGFRIAGHHNGSDTFSATHMRMDALVYGVLISLFEYRNRLNQFKYVGIICFVMGLVTLVCGYYFMDELFYRHVVLHSVIAICIAGLLITLLVYKPPLPSVISSIAAYTYNWYLWHPIIAFLLIEMCDMNIFVTFILYIGLSFFVAMITTKLIEKPFLKIRGRLIQRISK